MPNHTVAQGECLLSIAEKNGFFWETLWNHPQNAELKATRKDPAVLYPGDVVFVPQIRPKEVKEATDQVHKYQVKNTPAKFQVRLVDDDGKARAGLEYVLKVDGVEFTGKTDGEGGIRISIPPGASSGELNLKDGDEEELYDLALGFLDPIEELTGVQGRLRGLGYYLGDISGKESGEMTEAVKEFQEENGLEATGEVDSALKDKLKSAFGS